MWHNSLNPNKVLNMIPNSETPDTSIEDSIEVEDSVLSILKNLRYETPPKTRAKRTRLHVEPGRSVGVSSSESENGENEENLDDPDFLLIDIDDQNTNNVNTINTNAPDNNNPDEINTDIPHNNDQTIPVTISKSVKYVQINDTIKIVQNVYDINKLEIKMGDWLLVQFHSNMYICKVNKVGVIDFEGEFLRKKPSLKKDSGFMLFVYPQVPDEFEFMYDQIIGKLDPPIIRRGIHKFNVIF